MRQAPKLKVRRAWFIFIMVLPAILFPMIFTYYPTTRGPPMTFWGYNLMNVKSTKWVGLDNFSELFAHNINNTFHPTIFSAARWVGIPLLVQLTMGSVMALLLKKELKDSDPYRDLIFLPWAVSEFVINIMWYWMFNGISGVISDLSMGIRLIGQPVGWLASRNTALYSCIIANTWHGIPFFTIMITAALRGTSEDLYEAADMGGANSYQKFTSIIVPCIHFVLLLTVLLRVIWIFSLPDLIYSMTQGGPAGPSNIATSHMVRLVQSLNYSLASAVDVLCTLFSIAFTAIYLVATKYTGEEAWYRDNGK